MLATRAACNKEGNGNSNEGHGVEGGKQAMATRAMVTMWVMETAMRLADDKEGKGKGKGKGRKGNDNGNVRVSGKKEGKGSKAMVVGTRMVGKWTVTATKRVMVMARRMVGEQGQQQQRGQW